MMDNANITELCRHSDNIVSYLYDELAAGERARFETHLVDCTACTDEFAAVADSRFSVYEWHREEFLPLATPQFTIPYEPASATSRPGVLSLIAELLTFSRPAFAMGGIAVVLALGVIAITFLRSDDPQVAANVNIAEPSIDTPAGAPLPPQPLVSDRAIVPITAAAKPVKAAARTRTAERPARRTADDARANDQERQARKAPVLTEDIDIEDDSLRLTDLFDEVGG